MEDIIIFTFIFSGNIDWLMEWQNAYLWLISRTSEAFLHFTICSGFPFFVYWRKKCFSLSVYFLPFIRTINTNGSPQYVRDVSKSMVVCLTIFIDLNLIDTMLIELDFLFTAIDLPTQWNHSKHRGKTIGNPILLA